MAVFPDRIVLKNSTDDEATIISEIETGGASAITQGEVVLGLANGSATLYTKDALGGIVTISGSGGGDSPETPVVVGSTIDSDSAPDTSFTLTSPGSAEGDLLVACIMNRQSGGVLTPPTDFTLYGSYLSSMAFSGDVQTISVFTKTATASEPASYTWTQPNSARICGWVATVNGADDIQSVSESYGNSTTASINTSDGALNLTAATWVYATSGSEAYSQAASGLTEITDSPGPNARISGGYLAGAQTVVSTHTAADVVNDPNHGIIAIRVVTPPEVAGVTSIIAGSGISVDQATGDVTVTATGGGGGGGAGNFGGDPLFSKVTALATFDGETDGASTWTTYGSTSPTWTANGATISNAKTRWGGTTSLSVGAGAPSIPMQLGTDDWTIEAWVILDQGTWNNFGSIIKNGVLADTYDAVYVGPNGSNTSARFRISNSSSALLNITGACVWLDDEWNHVAICRAGDVYSAYVNGKKVGSGVQSGRTFNSGDLEVGGSGSSTAYAQDLRITSGVARYSTEYYPVPAGPLPTN